jgi:hypothetical protein
MTSSGSSPFSTQSGILNNGNPWQTSSEERQQGNPTLSTESACMKFQKDGPISAPPFALMSSHAAPNINSDPWHSSSKHFLKGDDPVSTATAKLLSETPVNLYKADSCLSASDFIVERSDIITVERSPQKGGVLFKHVQYVVKSEVFINK